jgi:hypothetical protein
MYISFFIIVFLQGVFFIYFPLHIHVYILTSGPLMNTSVVHNNHCCGFSFIKVAFFERK